MSRRVILAWERFERLTAAPAAFATRCCIYVQADAQGRAIRVGKASKGLVARYRRGTGYALDAAMHGSGNFVYVAAVEPGGCAAVEAALSYQNRGQLRYNRVGKIVSPVETIELVHQGDGPRFEPAPGTR